MQLRVRSEGKDGLSPSDETPRTSGFLPESGPLPHGERPRRAKCLTGADRVKSTATIRRANNARLEPDMVIERWNPSAKVTFDRQVLNELVCTTLPSNP